MSPSQNRMRICTALHQKRTAQPPPAVSSHLSQRLYTDYKKGHSQTFLTHRYLVSDTIAKDFHLTVLSTAAQHASQLLGTARPYHEPQPLSTWTESLTTNLHVAGSESQHCCWLWMTWTCIPVSLALPWKAQIGCPACETITHLTRHHGHRDLRKRPIWDCTSMLTPRTVFPALEARCISPMERCKFLL